MYCSNCGKEVGDVNYCSHCGNPVTEDALIKESPPVESDSQTQSSVEDKLKSIYLEAEEDRKQRKREWEAVHGVCKKSPTTSSKRSRSWFSAPKKNQNRQVKSSTTSKPSGAWYLVPILFGFLGGAVGYFAVKEHNQNMADDMMVIGIITSVISFFIFMGLI